MCKHHISSFFFGGGEQEWPDNLYLLSLKASEHEDGVTLRLEHLFEKDEDPLLSKPIPVELSSLFVTPVSMAERRSLSTVWVYDQMDRWEWRTADRSGEDDDGDDASERGGPMVRRAAKEQAHISSETVLLHPKEIQTFAINFSKSHQNKKNTRGR